MGHNKRQRCIATWAACFAVLLASLAPSLSHLVAANTLSSIARQGPAPTSIGVHVHEERQGGAHAMHGMVAALSGDALIQHQPPDAATQSVSLPHGTGPHAPVLHFEHCPFCFTHAGSFGLAPSAVLSLPDSTGTTSAPDLFYQWPGRAFIWTTAQARAPPDIA